jgi:predicted nucleic acid-binding protein
VDGGGVRTVRGGSGSRGAARRGALALSRYCLDTSAYSQFKRGNLAAIEAIDGAEWIGVPAIVLGELHVGFLLSSQAERHRRELEEFLASPVVEEIRVDHEIARLYGEIVVSLRRAGTPLPTNDIWVAASTARAGATLLTFDAHFAHVHRIGSLILESGK